MTLSWVKSYNKTVWDLKLGYLISFQVEYIQVNLIFNLQKCFPFISLRFEMQQTTTRKNN